MGKKKIFTSDAWENFIAGIAALKDKIDGKADEHTHPYLSSDTKYAGSSTAGGSATSAVKLDTASAGSETNPVYFADGKPVKTTYTLGASVPSGAKFTDTVYTLPVATSSALGGVKSGGDVTISSTGAITVNDDSHNHTISNVDNLQSELDSINTGIDGSIKALSVSGKTITYTKNDDTTGTITTQDTNTDTKVNVSLGKTTKAYLLGTSTTPTTTAQGVTSIADTGVYLDTVDGQLTATKFKGALEGKATSAGSADSATNDGAANNIVDTYETKSDSTSKLNTAKTYAAEIAETKAKAAAQAVKDDLLDGAGDAYDTLKELGDLIDDNVTAIDALETVAGGKADKVHTHAISDVTDLSTSLADKVSKSSNSTLQDGISTTWQKFTNRKVIITGNDITFDMSAATGGWAGNFAAIKDPAGDTTPMIGIYGGESGLTHIFMGGTYSDPYMKMTKAGQFTFKNTPYVGNKLVSLAGHTHTVSHTPTGGISEISITPAGTVSKPTFTGTTVTSGAPSDKTDIYSITGVGTLPSHTYTAPSHTYTAPSLTASCANRCLTLTWSAGTHSFSAGSHSFSAGTLPTRSSVISVALGSHTHSVTAAGSVSQPTFTGTAAKHSHTFTGTAATITTSGA